MASCLIMLGGGSKMFRLHTDLASWRKGRFAGRDCLDMIGLAGGQRKHARVVFCERKKTVRREMAKWFDEHVFFELNTRRLRDWPLADEPDRVDLWVLLRFHGGCFGGRSVCSLAQSLVRDVCGRYGDKMPTSSDGQIGSLIWKNAATMPTRPDTIFKELRS
jgi:hypothetical protein